MNYLSVYSDEESPTTTPSNSAPSSPRPQQTSVPQNEPSDIDAINPNPTSASTLVVTTTPPHASKVLTKAPESEVQTPEIKKTLVTGTIETIDFDEAKFSQLERRFATTGTTIDPKTGAQIQPRSYQTINHHIINNNNKNDNRKDNHHQHQHGASKRSHNTNTNEEQQYDDNTHMRRKTTKRPRSTDTNKTKLTTNSESSQLMIPTSQLHVDITYDYQNRSWISPTSSARTFADLETYTPYIPKRVTHSVKAHERGVSTVSFCSLYGHLILTTGLDGIARIWSSSLSSSSSSSSSTSTSISCIRSYTGHSKGIRDCVANEMGDKFLTAGYDRAVRLWDIESGRVIGSYKMNAIPFCVRFTPSSSSLLTDNNDNNGTEFLVGCGDKKILQIDSRDANSIVQQYDQHMGAVNSISFIDDDRRFVSSADDKVLLLWEYGIPVVIRHLSDPSSHSMPVTLLHPNRKSLACQSMDNTIRIFSVRDKFKPNPKKIFNGHLVAGYACGLKTSPDGRFLASADSMGRLFFWDWKSTRMFRSVKGHNGVCIGVDWHPTQPSLVASCGWDGMLKLWD